MSTYSKAVQRSEQQPGLKSPAPSLGNSGSRDSSEAFTIVDRTELYRAEADMEVLYKSITSALGDISGGKSILFASAHSREGKTTVVAALASTLAKNFNLSVLVIDATKRHDFSRAFAAESVPSVEALVERAPEIVRAIKQNSGSAVVTVPVDVSTLMSKNGSVDSIFPPEKIEFLKSCFDFIFIDVPSLAETAWVVGVGRQVDGVVLVVEAERTRWPVARHALREFERIQTRVLGVFLNKRRFYIPPKVYAWL